MEQPNAFVFVALVAYIPLAFLCLLAPGGRRGLLLALMGGWLFLPWFRQFNDSIPLLHTKNTFVSGILLSASLLLHRRVWQAFRPRPLDLVMVAYCLVPLASALAAGKGWYEGTSAVVDQFLVWGAPYLMGRAYFGSRRSLGELARSLVVAGLAYVPVCLWEIRMSPQLHHQIYGYAQHSFLQHVRDGHFRPMAFLAHGLMVAMFMGSMTLLAYWLWRSRTVRAIGGVGMGWVTGLLAVTTVLCRSAGSTILLLFGILVLETTRLVRAPVLVLVLALVPAAYCTARIQGADASNLVGYAAEVLNQDRADSLRFRLRNEDLLMQRALERPVTGWGRGDDARVRDEDGRDISVIDGLWLISLGTTGLLGLITLGVFLASHVLVLGPAVPRRAWGHPAFAPAVAMSVSLGLWAIDNLLNAMVSPIFPLMAGAVSTFALGLARARAVRRAAPRPALVAGTASPA